MDAVDYHLVAKAQSLAGRDVHRLNQLLHAYLFGYEAWQLTRQPRALRIVIEAERKLRAFVVMKELAQAARTPLDP